MALELERVTLFSNSFIQPLVSASVPLEAAGRCGNMGETPHTPHPRALSHPHSFRACARLSVDPQSRETEEKVQGTGPLLSGKVPPLIPESPPGMWEPHSPRPQGVGGTRAVDGGGH